MTTPTDRDAEPRKASLFEDLPAPSESQVKQAQAKAALKRSQGAPRLLEPNRLQVELRASNLESLLSEDHRARLVWGYVVRQDLSKLFDAIKARSSNAGRAAIDPRILFALWLYATLEGVGSGREVAATKRRNGSKPEDARASTTDADARVMKMGDGGFRPAFNVQFATDCEGQVIVGMDVVTSGSDMAQLAPMVDQVEQRLGETPEQWLVDGGFPAHEQIDAVAGKTELYAPVPKAKPPKVKDKAEGESASDAQATQTNPPAPATAPSEFEPKPGDSEAVAQWRQRMNTDAAREIYKLRAATAECVNAQARNRGLLRMPVRGLTKVKCVVRLFVLAHNLLRMATLAPQLIGWGTAASAAVATIA